jgi:predicted house-cleaning noncanonical NTP pyrophosphatase (MazG superfamily)
MSSDRLRTFRLEKLVRDGIVASHEAVGGSCVSRQIADQELANATQHKVLEEVGELFRPDQGRTPSEYADVIEAVLKDAEVAGISPDEVMRAMQAKKDRMGGFSTNTFVETATVPETSWLAEYYASQPDRFPEI